MFFFISKILGHCYCGKTYTKARSGRLIHLTENHDGFINNARGFHFIPEVITFAGPLTDNSLLKLIARLGAGVSGLESCTSPDRWKPLAAAGATVTSGDTASHLALARQVLDLGMCPRRSTAERRVHLARRLDESRPSSVIYARQSFCDPGAYDAVLTAELAEERGLPFLEIEVGFPFEAGGPLHTRVEAFLEAQLLDDDLLDDLDDDLLDDFPDEE